ncbi:MAG: hypothetical protein COB66_02210 [Coxiella sp. (in: Bacteria)]|nr:MAG: hypothetical protein COB66_02210 [Coxiella sp. (in: g-proteobacteria)]
MFAKFGPAFVLQKTQFDWLDDGVDVDSISHKQHGVKPFLSVGMAYNINNIEIGIAYDHLFGKAPSKTDVSRPLVGYATLKKGIFSQGAVMGSVGYALPV